jgi:hypothetical protein
MSNIEAAAEVYAQRKQREYVMKRGGSVPARAAFDVYMWAFQRFMRNPDACSGATL